MLSGQVIQNEEIVRKKAGFYGGIVIYGRIVALVEPVVTIGLS